MSISTKALQQARTHLVQSQTTGTRLSHRQHVPHILSSQRSLHSTSSMTPHHERSEVSSTEKGSLTTTSLRVFPFLQRDGALKKQEGRSVRTPLDLSTLTPSTDASVNCWERKNIETLTFLEDESLTINETLGEQLSGTPATLKHLYDRWTLSLPLKHRKQATLKYFAHHAALILKKLKHQASLHPSVFTPNHFCGKNMLQQLLQRYNREHVKRETPVLRKVFEQTLQTPSALVLFVYHVCSSDWIILCDGWYLMPAKVHSSLASYVSSPMVSAPKKLSVGSKIMLCGAPVTNLSPDANVDPVKLADELRSVMSTGNVASLSSMPYFTLNQNSTIPCGSSKHHHWFAAKKVGVKLGEQRRPFFVKRLSSVISAAGPVPCIIGEVSVVYGVFFCEVIDDGQKRRVVFRCETEEDLASTSFRNSCESISERILQNLSASGTQSARSLYDRVYRHEDFPRERNVKRVLKFRVSDGSNVSAEVSLWSPDNSILSKLDEGAKIMAFFLQPDYQEGSVFHFKTTKNSFFHVFKRPAVDPQKQGGVNNLLSSCTGLTSLLRKSPPSFSGAVIAVLLSTQFMLRTGSSSKSGDQVVFFLLLVDSSTLAGNVFSVGVPVKTRQEVDVMKARLRKAEGKLVMLRNIQYSNRDPYSGIHVLSYGKTSSFHLRRMSSETGSQSRLLNKQYGRMNVNARTCGLLTQERLSAYQQELQELLRVGIQTLNTSPISKHFSLLEKEKEKENLLAYVNLE